MAYLTILNIYKTCTPGQVLEIKCAQKRWLLFPQGHTSWASGSLPTILSLKAKWAMESLPAQLPDKLLRGRAVTSRMQISRFIFKSN